MLLFCTFRRGLKNRYMYKRCYKLVGLFLTNWIFWYVFVRPSLKVAFNSCTYVYLFIYIIFKECFSQIAFLMLHYKMPRHEKRVEFKLRMQYSRMVFSIVYFLFIGNNTKNKFSLSVYIYFIDLWNLILYNIFVSSITGNFHK